MAGGVEALKDPTHGPDRPQPSSGCRTQRRLGQVVELGTIRATEGQRLHSCRWWLVSEGGLQAATTRVSTGAASRLGHDIPHGLERPDLLGHDVSDRVPGHVHQCVAEVCVNIHARQAWVMMVQEPRFLFGSLR